MRAGPGCGPCRGDFPTVKLAYDLYRDHGLTVIGVHDNSSPHETIREHAETQKMEMPIVIDHEDGRIISAYKKLSLMVGYPSYLVLDREGRLITADSCIPGPCLRNYKLEIIRQMMLRNQSK